ncbi:uncharacterized protein LOC124998380 [Mugil cephalus]|uniref:uncharacterized protein LOC124998380 n=1 Tax=Mugil cephalus TaxID=48193 RepID=UPI001FB58168|nr:uncharacterized protein LOC124998380 [Mugil cephalus]
MDSADILVEKIFSAVKLQNESVEKLKKLATELEGFNKNINVSKVVGSSATAGGLAALTLAGVAAVCTGGAAIPFLATTGALATGVGLATNMGSDAAREALISSTMKEANKVSEEIKSLGEEIEELMEMVSKEKARRRRKVSQEKYVMERILRAIAKRNGLELKDKYDLITFAKRHLKKDMDFNILKKTVLEQSLLLKFVKGSVSNSTKTTIFEEKTAKELESNFTKIFESFDVTVSPKVTKHVAQGVAGLMFAVPELIVNIENLNNTDNAASETLRNLAETIETTAKDIQSELDEIEKLCQTLAKMETRRRRSCVIL